MFPKRIISVVRAIQCGGYGAHRRHPRSLCFERLDNRVLLACDWTNATNTLDFDGNKFITPIDVLVGINELNTRSIIEADGSLPDRAGHPDAPLWDSNCDGILSPTDILRVVNSLNLDQSPPTLFAALSNDTAPGGANNDDRITSDAQISGNVSDDLTGISSLLASVDGGNAVALDVDIDGNFSFDPGFVTGGSDEGEHTVRLTAADGRGQSTSVDVVLTLDTVPPQPPSTPDLAAFSDGGASDTDNLTDDSTPTFIVNGYSDGGVRLLVGEQGPPAQGVTVVASGDCDVPASAEYQLEFLPTWSSTTHPISFPAGAHFSGLVGGTHHANTVFWEEGQLASAGIESMAESGSKTQLIAEVNAEIALANAGVVISGSSTNSPGQAEATFTATQAHPHVTVVSMVAPSPDWFVGVNGLNLFQEGQWVREVVVELQPYDAGTDSGPSYTSPNADTNPPEPISEITATPLSSGGPAVPLGTFTFTRVDGPECTLTTETLADGTYHVSAVTEDRAGNQSLPSAALTVIIDTARLQIATV